MLGRGSQFQVETVGVESLMSFCREAFYTLPVLTAEELSLSCVTHCKDSGSLCLVSLGFAFCLLPSVDPDVCAAAVGNRSPKDGSS